MITKWAKLTKFTEESKTIMMNRKSVCVCVCVPIYIALWGPSCVHSHCGDSPPNEGSGNKF